MPDLLTAEGGGLRRPHLTQPGAFPGPAAPAQGPAAGPGLMAPAMQRCAAHPLSLGAKGWPMDERSAEEFREYMHGRWPGMVRLAYGLTGDHGHAEDVAAAAFARAYASWPRVMRSGNPARDDQQDHGVRGARGTGLGDPGCCRRPVPLPGRPAAEIAALSM